MALKDELESKITDVFKYKWTIDDGYAVPEPNSLPFRNVGRRINGAVLYADLDRSTSLVDTKDASRAAEIYKSYLYCAGRIINANLGTITAYDGDRVMAIFTGVDKETEAVSAALQINWALLNIINPLYRKQYPSDLYEVKHTIGVDTSELLVAKTGVRGDNDLVWVGRSANHAAKLTRWTSETPVYVTKEIYDAMQERLKKDSNGIYLWKAGHDPELSRPVYFGNIWLPIVS